MSYKIESIFEYKRFKCVVIMTEMGHRCGYVGVSEDHCLFGKDYSAKIGKFEDIKNNSINKMSPINALSLAFEEPEDDDSVRIDCYFNVHGGITYAGGGKHSTYPIESDLWWFGYDCAHAGDGKDLDAIENEQIRDTYKGLNFGVIRTTNYCINECKSLAEQLSNL